MDKLIKTNPNLVDYGALLPGEKIVHGSWDFSFPPRVEGFYVLVKSFDGLEYIVEKEKWPVPDQVRLSLLT